MTYTKEDQLIARIHDNYASFKASLQGVSRDTLFQMANRIGAVTEAYKMLTTDYTWTWGAFEIDFYLLFRDPLTIIADAWAKQRNEMVAEFDAVVSRLFLDDDVFTQYPLMEGIGEGTLYVGDAGQKIRIY